MVSNSVNTNEAKPEARLSNEEWGSQYESIDKWLLRRPKSRRVYLSTFRRWFDWASDNIAEVKGLNPDELVAFQKNARKGEDNEDYHILDKTATWILEKGREGKWRRGYQKKNLTTVRSFFKSNRVALPDDGEIWRDIDNGIAPDDAPELMTLEIAKRVVENSNELYKAIFLSMIAGGMGLNEIIKFSQQGIDSIKKGIIRPKEERLLRINFTGRKTNRHPYFTLIGGDALTALETYLNVRKSRKKAFEKNTGNKYPTDIFVTNTHNPILQEHTIRTYWLRKLHRIGLINRIPGAPSSTRYGLHPHQLRDLFKNQWTIAHRGQEDKISEFILGHRLDRYNYNKFYKVKMGQEVVYEEYLKTLPYVNIISSSIPFGLIDSTEISTIRGEVEQLKKRNEEQEELIEALSNMIRGNNPSRDLFAKVSINQDKPQNLPQQDNNETVNLKEYVEFLQTRPDYQEWLESRKIEE